MSNNQTAPDKPSDPNADPLTHLHRMSTTAGIGTGEYVAINNFSIAALLLGVGGSLALFHPIWLVVPLVAAIFSIVALRQVRQSNGTQTGGGFAWLGLVLAIGFFAFIGARTIMANRAQHADEQKVVNLIDRFGSLIEKSEYAQAYQLFSEEFQKRRPVSVDTFTQKWQQVEKLPAYGKLTGLRWNGQMLFQDEPATGVRYAMTQILLSFQKAPAPMRLTARFRMEPDGWKFDDLPELFPAPEKRRQ